MTAQDYRQNMSTAENVREEISRRPDQFWRPEDFANWGDYEAVMRELARMVKSGLLRRIRRGLYWSGASMPSPLQVAKQLMGEEGLGPAGAEAAAALGLCETVPDRPLIAIPRRPPRLSAEERGRVEYISRAGRDGRRTQQLQEDEVAILEVLAAPEAIEVGPRAGTKILMRTIKTSRPEALARAAATEDAIVREGLRNLLPAAGFEREAQLIPPARSNDARSRAFQPSIA